MFKVEASSPDSETGSDDSDHPMIRDIRWFVRLRWLAIFLIGAGWLVLHAVISVWVLAVLAVLALLNVLTFFAWRSAPVKGQSVSVLTALRFPQTQIATDYLALVALLHFGGVIEGPFSVFLLFHAVLAAVLLPAKWAWGLTAFGAMLFGSVVMLEASGLIPHPHLQSLMPLCVLDTRTALVHAGVMALAMLVTTYLVRTVRRKEETAQRMLLERERLAGSREQFARMGELSVGVAHAIRNPLHGALNCVDILDVNCGCSRKEEGETFLMLRESLKGIENVTGRLLELSPQQSFRRRLVDVADVCREVVALVQPRASRKGLHLEVDYPENAQAVLEAGRMVEALVNLMDNAIHASPEGEVVRLAAHLETHSPGEPGIAFEVEDNGSGIASEHLKQVFDPFFTTKPPGEGTGLGLPITLRIVEAHGGEFLLLPREGKGTMARILLPLFVKDTAWKS